MAPLRVPPVDDPPMRDDLTGAAAITVSAEGSTMLVSTTVPQVTHDGGQIWHPVRGLPGRTRAVADKVDPAVFYAADVESNRLLVSRDAGGSFAATPANGLPETLKPASRQGREAQSALLAAPDRAGDLWLQAGRQLFHSTAGGRHFALASGSMEVELYGLGKGSVFAVGTLDGLRAI